MIVIKIGGGKTIDLDAIIKDLKTLNEPFILVHGGNYILNRLIKKLGIKNKFLNSPDGQVSRYTNREVIEMMFMSYAGYMNKIIVEKLQQVGINAVGFSGIDGKLVVGKRHKAIIAMTEGKRKVIRNDMTGTVENIDINLLRIVLKKGFIPVICPPGLSSDSQAINVDGDKIAVKIAAIFKATVLIFLIEFPGFANDINDVDSVIPLMKKEEIKQKLTYAEGRMKKKLIVNKWALDNGVRKIVIADGRCANPITTALFKKGGTTII